MATYLGGLDDPSARTPLTAALHDATRALFILFSGSIPAEYSLVLPVLGSVTRILGGLLLLACVADVISRGESRRLPGVFLLPAAFVLWSLASITWSYAPGLSIGRSVTYVQLLVMAWVTWEYVRTEQDLLATLQAYVIGALFVAAVTIREFQTSSLAISLVTSDVRVAAFGANPNELALTMVTAIPLAMYLLRRKPTGWAAAVNLAYMATGTLAVILTASRTGAIALAIAAFGMLVMVRDARQGTKAMLVAGLLLIVVLFVSFVPDYTLERIASIGAKLQRMDFNNRSQNWQAGLTMLAERPLVGVGAGAFQGATAHMIQVPRSSHSTWIGVLVETGIVGATLWFCFVIASVLALRRSATPLRRALVAAIVPMMVGMLVTGWDHRKVPWLLFAAALCSANLVVHGPRSDDSRADAARP